MIPMQLTQVLVDNARNRLGTTGATGYGLIAIAYAIVYAADSAKR